MKSKRKNRSKSQRVQAKMATFSKSGDGGQAAADGKKPNPFDLVFTKRQKNPTIGKKPAARKPRPKQNSTEIRKQTLEEEFRRRGKANQFVDRRLGQRNVEMSEEARAEKRFLFQQRKLAEKRTTALGSAEDGKGPTNPLLLENATKQAHWKDLMMAADEKAKHEDNAGESSGNDEEAEDGMENAHKNRKKQLADQVRDDSRLRALKLKPMLLLRNEQEEQPDRLDRCYREMRKLGMLQPMGMGGQQRPQRPPLGLEQSNKANYEKREQSQQADEQEDNYDSMYHELQFQSSQTTAASIPSTPTVAAKNSTKIRAAAPFDKLCQQKNQRSLKMLEPRIDEHFKPERHGKGNSAKFGGKDSAKERGQQWAKRAWKERRGAIKELRKDARHLAGLYAEQQRKVRRERDEKTKRIRQSLETQVSEYKKLRAISGKLK